MKNILVLLLLLILVLTVVIAVAAKIFQRMVAQEVKSLLKNGAESRSTVVTSTMVESLPLPVKNWLLRSNILGKPMINITHLYQTGEMRTSRDGKWMPFGAEQFSTTAKPGFVWRVNVTAAPLVHLAGRDKFVDGKGHMLIKIMSLFTVANSRGPSIDQGAILRFLGEIVWMPSAALRDYIRWDEIDATSARATITYNGISASGIFLFDANGDMRSMEAMRYYEQKKGATLEKWHIDADRAGFRDFDGIRIPAKCVVTWKLKEGDFTWLKLNVTDVTYNPPQL